MKVMTIAGTRPELIRLSRIIPALDKSCDHFFAWTSQNFSPSLSTLFFEDLGVRAPDVRMGVQPGKFGAWIGELLDSGQRLLEKEQPDKVLILGDTNSAMISYVAKRMGIPVYHMEAGNRCHDDRVPEEVNRKVVDACSSVLMPYTNRSRDNLLAEGYPAKKIRVTGNPICEVLDYYRRARADSDALERLGLHPRQFILATAHRAENVDDPARLQKISSAFDAVAREFNIPLIVSTHPRTRDRLNRADCHEFDSMVRWLDPMGFHDFTRLEQDAALVITDSGTCQEEACIFHVPSVTIREATERPETVDCGSNIVAGVDPGDVLAAASALLKSKHKGWPVPAGYLEPNCSQNVVSILLSKEAL